MEDKGENSVSRDYSFTVQISDGPFVPLDYAERVKRALIFIKYVACGEITEHTYEDANPSATLNETQQEAVREFDERIGS